MQCPLWSLFMDRKAMCIKDKCGMFNLCRPVTSTDQRIDRCPQGHDKITEVTGSVELASGTRVFLCLEEGCDERWTLPVKIG